MNNYDLKKKDDSWVLQKQGTSRASINFGDASKADALHDAAKFLKSQPTPSSLHVHKENGVYQEERTYPRSADPRRSPG